MINASQIIELFKAEDVLRFGDFTLKSGRKSSYFFNLGHVSKSSSFKVLIESFAELIAEQFPKVDLVFGPAYKGIPIVSALSVELERKLNRPISFAYDRKEIKDHGEGGLYVGKELESSQHVVIVDDVLTAGTSASQSIKGLRDSFPNIHIAGLVIAMDRQENYALSDSDLTASQAIEKNFNVNVKSLLKFSDLPKN